MRNRAGAHYCRKCHTYLEPPVTATLSGAASQADFLSLRGCFRRPPLLMNGMLYALDTAGRLLEIAPRTGSEAREVARLKSGEAGFNSGCVVEAAASAKGLRGYLYLAVSPSKLEAVSLATGKVSLLYEPRDGESIVANSSETDSTAFKGVAATPGCAAIAVRTAAGEIALTLVYFSGERATEQPLKITGTNVCGPWLSGRFITLCTEESAGVYDLETGRAFVAALPDDFRPMMNREKKGIGVSPGQMPLSAIVGESGIEAWIAGYQADRARGRDAVRHGLLRISMEHSAYFFSGIADGEDFCFYGLPEEKFFVGTFAGIEFPGQSNESALRETMKGGMPVSLDSGTAAYFRNDPDQGWHQIAIGSGASAATAFFQDAENECDEDSCCGILIDGPDVVVPFLRISSDPAAEGLKLAHWRFA
ncbi:PQQ-binding-like beta-propeller repeat protein [Terracidiphilus gabretensis]|uniref:hypothetical protein n=1 Tax=Terracidiphilus gabretensis TaxID=1577687 RepID=UPI00071B90D7|nr:hypothetical protein [Terracidiphilus gabretensis]